MNVLALEGFIVRSRMYKVLTIILHTTQVTQATSLLEAQPKIIFNIDGDHLTPSMVIVLSIHALHFGKAMNIGKQRQQFKQGIPIKNNQ
jgi:hypothetical protein